MARQSNQRDSQIEDFSFVRDWRYSVHGNDVMLITNEDKDFSMPPFPLRVIKKRTQTGSHINIASATDLTRNTGLSRR